MARVARLNVAAPRTDTPARTPPLELLLGYGPALLLPLLGALAWTGSSLALEAGRLWGAAILLFLAGVTRGLSFFTEGGPRIGQLAAMMCRFLCGLGALVLPAPLAFAALVAGYVSVGLYDPVAVRHGTAPRFFASLRPWQMAIAVAGLALLETRALA